MICWPFTLLWSIKLYLPGSSQKICSLAGHIQQFNVCYWAGATRRTDMVWAINTDIGPASTTNGTADLIAGRLPRKRHTCDPCPVTRCTSPSTWLLVSRSADLEVSEVMDVHTSIQLLCSQKKHSKIRIANIGSEEVRNNFLFKPCPIHTRIDKKNKTGKP